MKEVVPGLFVGSQNDYESVPEDWFVVQACKEPYHRQALGYTGRSAPADSPEYLMARRGNRLILNLVDARDAVYIPTEIITAALLAIMGALAAGKPILVHCNKGESRAPSIALLYMASEGLLPREEDEAIADFTELYPEYAPGTGMAAFVHEHWQEYVA